MSWTSLTSWNRPVGSFQLLLGYGEKAPHAPQPELQHLQSSKPAHAGNLAVVAQKHDGPAGQSTTLSSANSGNAGSVGGSSSPETGGGPFDPTSQCKIRVQMEWGAGEHEDAVALRLRSQLLVALPYPEEEVGVALEVQPLRLKVEPATSQPESHEPTELASPAGTLVPFLAEKPSLHKPAYREPPEGATETLQSPLHNVLDTAVELASTGTCVTLAKERRTAGQTQDGLLSIPAGQSAEESLTAEKADQLSIGRTLEDIDSEGVFVKVRLFVHKKQEKLRTVVLSKTAGSGTAWDGLGVLNQVITPEDLQSVVHLHMAEGSLSFLTKRTSQLTSLTVLNLSSCNLVEVPREVLELPQLTSLSLDHNKLASLPPELGGLTSLRHLSADHNLLHTVPIELRQCVALEELNLEGNRLVRPLLDFRAMVQLRALRLFGNPLEFLPEILPCINLRQLTLANVRIKSDRELRNVEVVVEGEAQASSYFGTKLHKLSAFFSLIFRYSSCQHPLLASALAKVAEEPESRVQLGRDEGAIRQLLSMVLSENAHVVQQACMALSSLAADLSLVPRLIRADVLQGIWAVLRSPSPHIQMSAMKVIASVAFVSDAAAERVLTQEVLSRLKEFCAAANSRVQEEALLAFGNLAFCPANQQVLVAAEGLCSLLARLAMSAVDETVRKSAMRALAIMGENEYVRRATRRRPISKQGVRILALDGGGMRGMSTVKMLRRLEQGTGRRIFDLFDLICGTSTGGMLAVALGMKHYRLEQCDDIYKTLGRMVFAETKGSREDPAASASWREKLDQLYKSGTQNLRVIVSGAKHDATNFENLLRTLCANEDGHNLLIDSCTLDCPKVAVVSTLVSVSPASPFVFRNYQYPAGTRERVPVVGSSSPGPSSPRVSWNTKHHSRTTTGGGAYVGSCKHLAWEAIRASSAAPYYLDDFTDGLHRWQDGAVTANNPALIALHEAQLLWPDLPVDCLVSLGCGAVPAKPRGKNWRYVDTGTVLIDSACSVERVEEALDTLAPMVPGLSYFRFNPVDERCGMELDETDPALWARLEAATEEYMDLHSEEVQAACARLLANTQIDGPSGLFSQAVPSTGPPSTTAESIWSEDQAAGGPPPDPSTAPLAQRSLSFALAAATSSESLGILQSLPADGVPSRGDSESPGACLGRRRGVLWVEAEPASMGQGGRQHVDRVVVERFCQRRGIALQILDCTVSFSETSTSEASGVAKGGSNQRSSGDHAMEERIRAVRRNSYPLSPASDDSLRQGGLSGGVVKEGRAPSPERLIGTPSPAGKGVAKQVGRGALSAPVLALYEKLLAARQVGLVHLALGGDEEGLALSWQGSLVALAEPSEAASRFLSECQHGGQTRPHNLAQAFSMSKQWAANGAAYSLLGSHTQVLPSGKEVGTFTLQRTAPASRLTAAGVRAMVGAWRDRLVICSRASLSPLLVDAFLDAGAKAVVAVSTGTSPLLEADFHGDRETERVLLEWYHTVFVECAGASEALERVTTPGRKKHICCYTRQSQNS